MSNLDVASLAAVIQGGFDSPDIPEGFVNCHSLNGRLYLTIGDREVVVDSDGTFDSSVSAIGESKRWDIERREPANIEGYAVSTDDCADNAERD